MQPRVIALFGAPGTGKGVQGRALGELPGFYYFSTGQTLRELDPRSDLGQKLHQFMRAGELLPADLLFSVWQQHMRRLGQTGEFRVDEDRLLLDGMPRTVEQARQLEEHARVVLVVHLRSKDDDQLVHRIRERGRRTGREDDSDEGTICHRFEVYREQTVPVLDYYGAGRVAEVDAIQPPLDVLAAIVEVLRQRL